MEAVADCQVKISDLPDGVDSVEELYEKLKDRLWRLNNLYWIRDEDGKCIKFKMNRIQMMLYLALWWMNLVLKSRQHGITTFVAIYFLDECFFNSNTLAGIIAHKLKDVQKIFRDKVKYAYNKMPEVLRKKNPAEKNDTTELILANGSSLYVGVSMRSGTLQLLHISEYGWLCAHAPRKAREIIAGAVETLHEGSVLIIESTAEGADNDFHLLCKAALKQKAEKTRLTRLDYKIHFYPWYVKDSNILSPEETKRVVINDKMKEYFHKVETVTGDIISPEHKAWYTKKKATLRSEIFKEHPSIPDEAFIANLEGAYWGHGMVKVKEDQRVGFYPWEKRNTVFTFWDFGTIHTAIWFWQFIKEEIRSLECFYDNSGQGLESHAKLLQDRPYVYAEHWCGWDLNKDNGSNRKNPTSGELILDDAKALGIDLQCLPKYSFQNRIVAVRDILDKATFDEEGCGDIGVPALFNFRQAKDLARSTDERIVFGNNPVPGPENHIADAYSHGALAYLYHIIVNNKRIGFAHATPANEQNIHHEEAIDYLRS